MKPTHHRTSAWAAFAVLALASLVTLRALVVRASNDQRRQEAPQPNVDDIVAQLRFYAIRLDDSLAKADAYDESKQTRVEKDAATVAALAALLSRHTADHAAKPHATAVQRNAADILANHRDHAKAAAANAQLKRLLADTKPTETQPAEAPSANAERSAADTRTADTAPMLMKQIRFVDNRLKRAARDRAASAKLRSEVAGHAATLAALAEPTAANARHYGKTPEQQQRWRDHCRDMATAAASLNLAAHDGAANLTEAVRNLDQSCNHCHAEFR